MGFFTGTKPKIITKAIRDPVKEKVASPLSSFLASRVGKGLPRYGGALVGEVDPLMKGRYEDYMSLKPEEFFREKVVQPTMEIAREELLPEVREGYAGALRGSGRYRGEEEFISGVTQKLGIETAKMVPSMYESQLKAGMSMWQIKDLEVQREYQDWYKSLPEMNPVLDKALGFLSKGVGTGTTTLSALDPGQKGAFWDLLGLGIQGAGMAAAGGAFSGGGGAGGDFIPGGHSYF